MRKSCYLAFVDGWVSALDALYVKAFSTLRNEEEMPILSNYLLEEPTAIKADMEGSLVEILEREKTDGVSMPHGRRPPITAMLMPPVASRRWGGSLITCCLKEEKAWARVL